MTPSEQRAPPDLWVLKHSRALKPGSTVLDLACGSGRHTRSLLAQGHRVVAVDRDLRGVGELRSQRRVSLLQHDLEAGPWPFMSRTFDAIVVCNYLHRPLFPSVIDALAPGGRLIYTTFMQGHERYGRPRRRDFLLRPGELRAVCSPLLQTLEFVEGYEAAPRPMQRQSGAFRKHSDELT